MAWQDAVQHGCGPPFQCFWQNSVICICTGSHCDVPSLKDIACCIIKKATVVLYGNVWHTIPPQLRCYISPSSTLACNTRKSSSCDVNINVASVNFTSDKQKNNLSVQYKAAGERWIRYHRRVCFSPSPMTDPPHQEGSSWAQEWQEMDVYHSVELPPFQGRCRMMFAQDRDTQTWRIWSAE